MKPVKVLLILMTLQLSCSKDETDEPADSKDPSVLIYSDPQCSIYELYWINNNTVLAVDGCGILKTINVDTKGTGITVNFLTEYQQSFQRGYYSELIPNSFFYIVSTNINDYQFALELYKLDLITRNIQLVADSLPNSAEGYIMGNKHLAVKTPGNDNIRIIDLENLTSQHITISNGYIMAFAPDDSQILINQADGESIGLYDFNCNCIQPTTLDVTGSAIWRSEGMFGKEYGIYQNGQMMFATTLIFKDLNTGLTIGEMPRIINELSVSQQGPLSAAFLASPNYEEDFSASLVTLDLLSQEEQTLVTVHYNILSTGYINMMTISPDQKKISYVYNGSDIKVVATK